MTNDRKLIDGHVVEIREERGYGRQIYLDEDNITSIVLAKIGPPMDDGHGMPIPRGNAYVFSTVKMMLRGGELTEVEV